MRPIWHILISFLYGVVVFVLTHSILGFLVAFLSGVFIDLDHLLDFWISRPEKPFSVRAFLRSDEYVKKNKRAFIIFHAWEWALALVLFSWYLNWPQVLTIFTGAICLHLILDIANLFNHELHPLTYFITFRLVKGFKVKKSVI